MQEFACKIMEAGHPEVVHHPEECMVDNADEAADACIFPFAELSLLCTKLLLPSLAFPPAMPQCFHDM